MNGTHDADQAGSADEGGELDPQQAAVLLEQTAIRARRQFEPSPVEAVAAVVGAGVFLLGYGAAWWSMRDQHVYTGPAGWSVAALPRRELRDRLRRVRTHGAAHRPRGGDDRVRGVPREVAGTLPRHVIMLIDAVSTFFGPKGAWGLTGLGCCTALLVYAGVKEAWLRRHVPHRRHIDPPGTHRAGDLHRHPARPARRTMTTTHAAAGQPHDG